MKEMELSKYIALKFKTPDSYSHWFGYYNYCPCNKNGELLLAHRADFDGRDVRKEDCAQVGYFNMNTGDWTEVGETDAFNWQQGAMLQWLNENELIYNIRDGQHFAASIYHLESKTTKNIHWPVYGITPDGRYSVTLDFERSYWCRAYHYESIQNINLNRNIVEDDGIFLIDLYENTRKKIISIQDILKIDPISGFENRKHWLEHIMLNRDGSRFAFYHRFSTEDGGFWTRVFTANLDGSDLYLMDGWRKNEYSHMNWINEKEFYIFSRHIQPSGKLYTQVTEGNNRFGKALQQIYRKTVRGYIHKYLKNQIIANKRYQVISDRQGVTGELPHGFLNNDGHPSFTKDQQFMLTDTYALEDGYRYLLLYGIKKKRLFKLGRFLSPYNECGYRSDLHPRFSQDERYIIIDSAQTKRRQMFVFELNWKIIEQEYG